MGVEFYYDVFIRNKMDIRVMTLGFRDFSDFVYKRERFLKIFELKLLFYHLHSFVRPAKRPILHFLKVVVQFLPLQGRHSTLARHAYFLC